MTTIINNPPSSDNSGGPLGMIVGLIVLVILIYLGIVYGLPAIQRMQIGTPLNVPGKIDINVNQPQVTQ